MHPAIFLDRDGVIIENRSDYVRSWDDVEIFPQALDSLSRIKSCPFKIVIITNQSAIGRGIITLDQAEYINRRLMQIINKAGGRIDAVFMCPHKPAAACSCRKPKPGMIFKAADELSIDLGRSILIGDAITDIQAGLSAGLKKEALVRTGLGAQQDLSNLAAQTSIQIPVFNDLSEALENLIKN